MPAKQLEPKLKVAEFLCIVLESIDNINKLESQPVTKVDMLLVRTNVHGRAHRVRSHILFSAKVHEITSCCLELL